MPDVGYESEVNRDGNSVDDHMESATVKNSNDNGDSKAVANWFVMTGALIRKNYLMLWSAKIQLLLIIFIPIIFFILGVMSENGIDDSISSFFDRSDNNFGYDSSVVPAWTKCEWKNVYNLPSDDCFTIMYTYDHNSTNSAMSESESSALVDSIMETLAKSNDLTIEKISAWAQSNGGADVDTQIAALVASYGKADIVGVSSPDILASFLAQEDGHVDSSILFQTPKATDTHDYEFTNKHNLFDVNILQNKTSWYGSRESEEFYFSAIKKAAFKVLVDNKPINIKVDIQNEEWGQDGDYYGNYYNGSGYTFVLVDAFLVIAYCIISILFMNFIAREKQQELIGSLRLMGMHDSAYWASWLVVITSISIFSSLSITITSHIVAYEKLSKVNFAIPFIVLSISQIVLMTTSLILVPLSSNQRMLNVLQLFLLIMFFASYSIAVSSEYQMKPSSIAGRIFHTFVPATNFVRILGPVLGYSSKYGVHENLSDVYNWELFDTRLNECNTTYSENDNGDSVSKCYWQEYRDYGPDECNYYSYGNEEKLPDYCFYSAQKHSSLLGTMIIQMLIYFVLTSYLLIVIPSGNGIARRVWFFLDPSYWIQSKNNDSNHISVNDDPNKAKSFEERSLLMTGLVKQFRGNVFAVKDMNLEIHEGQIFALLGHNGGEYKFKDIIGIDHQSVNFIICSFLCFSFIIYQCAICCLIFLPADNRISYLQL